MKTIKFRIVEEKTLIGYVEKLSFSVQLKKMFSWVYLTTGGEYPVIKEFKTKRECFEELYKESKFSPDHFRLKRYPSTKFIYFKNKN